MFGAMRIVAIALAVALAVCALLGYRVVRLEQRVAALGKQLGPPAALPEGGKSAPAQGGHEQRLAALEREIGGLRDDLATLEAATGERPELTALNTPGAEQRILSVVEREQHRIRDKQLQFHRARWLEWRQSALDTFAAKHGLSPVQTERIFRLLADEVEALVELIKQPDVLANPDRTANDWLDRLEETNTAAHDVLDPEQRVAWDTARNVERETFWPWLPKR
jgi:hypothetical protein